ncbi:MAG TPA: fatty acid desaturase [Polyangiaceae bacterium]
MNQTLSFARTNTGEPHARRRRELLTRYPEIRKLAGFDRSTAAVAVAVSAAQLAIASIVGHARLRWWWVLPLAWAVGAPLTHWLSMAIHETSHRLAAKTRRANEVVALVANLPMVLPVAATFHRYHVDHHRLLDVLGGDTDLPLAFEVRWVGRSSVRKALWLFLHPLVYIARGFTFAKRPNRKEIANAIVIVLVDLAIARFLGGAALAYLAISFYFAHGLHPVAAHFVHEHYTFEKGQETYSYYGPINLIAFNVGFHNEHHDFMNVPGSRLPELRRLVPEYGALVSHRSWTGVLWRFIRDPALSYASRLVRTKETFLRARKEAT